MQEGGEELGAGHEDTVGQQEVTEERLCWTGLGVGRDFSPSAHLDTCPPRKHAS